MPKHKLGFRGQRNTGRKKLRGSEDADSASVNSDRKRPTQVNESPAAPVEDAPEEPGFRAYDALLTLLKDDTKEQARKKRKVTESTNEEGQQETEENMESVEGFQGIVEDEAEEDDEDENDKGDNEADDEIVLDDEGDGDAQDPFEWHFANPDESTLLKAAGGVEWVNHKYDGSLGGRSILSVPKTGALGDELSVKSFDSLPVKYRLQAPFQRENGDLSPLQKQLASPMFGYRDILYPHRTWDNASSIQRLYTLHIMNHIYKTRDRVLKHNARLSAAEDPSELELRDQGFTRPKVLVLLPTRNSAYEFISTVSKVSGLTQQENRKRFVQAFFDDAEPPSTKPDDFRKLFKGNTNDMFCLGVKFTRQAVKLYSSFYSSDLIIASPLGLRLIVGSKGDKKRDYDFLSSIELLVVDQADAIQMQNWDNVEHIFKHLNLVPKESHGCDFSRVRSWYLDEQANKLRQTLVISNFTTPEINGTLSRYCSNISGKLKVRSSCSGSMAQIGMRLRQVFTRIAAPDPVSDPDVRFRHFKSVLLPALQRAASYEGTLIIVPTYLDFIRLRNYFDDNNSPAWTISEYSSVSEVSRARSLFATGRTKILLYTERLHHFRRYDIKGVKQVVMYGVPENPLFYTEVMRFLVRTSVEAGVDPALLSARIIYSKWDSLKLERIVGTARVGALLQGTSDTYEFH